MESAIGKFIFHFQTNHVEIGMLNFKRFLEDFIELPVMNVYAMMSLFYYNETWYYTEGFPSIEIPFQF